MIVQFYTIHGKKVTVKNVESIQEAKDKLKKLKFDLSTIFKTDVNIEKVVSDV